MKKDEGKKLLIIGANAFFLDVVKICRKRNIKTIILDNNPTAISKKYADIALNVDTYDKDAVLAVAREYEIDGVFVGWSDHNLYTALYVAEKLNFPFYATEEQLDITTNKDRFKQLCIENDVPVFEEYTLTEEGLEDVNIYPIIIKPVDGAGSKGITICYNRQEVENAIKEARDTSFAEKYIIEKAVSYQHVNIYYTLADGEIYLSAMCDRNVYYPDIHRPPLPVKLVHPAKSLEVYEKTVNPKVVAMLKKIGMKNGVAFVQGFFDEKNEQFYLYEMGYRLNGGSTYFLIDHFSKYNQIDMLINHALYGTMGDTTELKKSTPHFLPEGDMLIVSTKPGKVAKIKGFDELKGKNGIIHIMQMYQEGDSVTVKSGVSQAQIFAYVYMIGYQQDTIEYMKKSLEVCDENGQNLLLDVWEIM